MNETEDLELEKYVSDISVISENENLYYGTIKWTRSDFMKNVSHFGKVIKSNWFSIGSPSYCSFCLRLQDEYCEGEIPLTISTIGIPNKWPIVPSGCSTLGIIFKNRLPESAWIEGKISVFGCREAETFSVCGKDANEQITLTLRTSTGKLKDTTSDCFYPVIECFMKIKLKEVKCTLDKHTIQRVENRNYNKEKNYLLKCNEFSDVTICVENCEIKSYKALLAKIPFFKQLFAKDESKQYFVLTDINERIFQSVLNYLYTEDIPDLNFKLACELYVVTGDLKLFDLKFICSSFLGANLTEQNVFVVLSMSDKLDDISLKKECIKFIKSSNLEQLTENSAVL